MAGETQTYKVETIYAVQDRASQALGEISKSANQSAASTHSLKTMLMSLGALNIGQRIFGAAKEHLIGYNSQLEQSQTVIAGMLTLYTGASIDRTWNRAATSVERFQEMAKKSSLTTKELVDTAQGLTRPLIQVGVKMADIEDITFGVANAAKAFGMSGSVVAMDVEQALRGSVTERDRFIKSMLAQKGIELSGEQFNKKGQAERIEILKKALTSKAISAMADKQAGSFSGVMSTMEDNLQIALSKIGLPLFKAITSEVQSWNAWIENNSSKIEEMGRSLSGYMMGAFRTIKSIASEVAPLLKSLFGAVSSVMSFAAEHKDTLIGLAKGLMVFKVGSMIGRAGMGVVNDARGFAGGLGGSLSGIKDALTGFRTGTASVGGLFGQLATNLPGVIGGLAKLGLAAYTLGGFMFGKTETQKRQESEAKARTLTADQYKKTKADVFNMTRELGSFAGGGDPLTARFAADSLKTMQDELIQKVADKKKYEAEVIKRGVEAGFVSSSAEYLKDGYQRVTKLNAGMGSTVDFGGHEALWKANESLLTQLGDIFGEKGTFSKGSMKGEFKEAIMEAQAETADQFDAANTQSAPVKQTVNITIQQVTAKDPNRWLAEMDDMVKRRTRAPTRPKRGLPSSPH